MLINPQIFKKNCRKLSHSFAWAESQVAILFSSKCLSHYYAKRVPVSSAAPPTEEATDRFKPWYILIQSQLNHICQFMQRLLSFVIK